jgi:hypothetical protein
MKYRTIIHGPKPNPLISIDEEIRSSVAISVEEAAGIFNNIGVDWYLIGSLGLSMHHHSSLNKGNLKKTQAKIKVTNDPNDDSSYLIEYIVDDQSLENILGATPSLSEFSLLRIPSNINIEIDRKDLQEFKDGIKDFKYKIYENVASLSPTKSSNLYVAIYKELSNLIKPGKIFTRPLLLESTNPKLDNPLLKHIDVRVCYKAEDGKSATIYHNGKGIHIDKPYHDRTVTLGDERINLRNIAYLNQIKIKSRHPLDIYDLRFVVATTANMTRPQHEPEWPQQCKKTKVGDKYI